MPFFMMRLVNETRLRQRCAFHCCRMWQNIHAILSHTYFQKSVNVKNLDAGWELNDVVTLTIWLKIMLLWEKEGEAQFFNWDC